jgi:ribosome-binding protein aMBF1 (putative translation factor)
MKKSSYMTRAMRAGDPRFARVLGKLGYERADMVAAHAAIDPLDHDGDGQKGGSPKPQASDNLTALRTQYQEKVGKRPSHGWDEKTLAAKIAEAKD